MSKEATKDLMKGTISKDVNLQVHGQTSLPAGCLAGDGLLNGVGTEIIRILWAGGQGICANSPEKELRNPLCLLKESLISLESEEL